MLINNVRSCFEYHRISGVNFVGTAVWGVIDSVLVTDSGSILTELVYHRQCQITISCDNCARVLLSV